MYFPLRILCLLYLKLKTVYFTAHSVPVNVPSRLSGHHIDSRDSDSGKNY